MYLEGQLKHFITATILLGLLLASCSPTISAEPVSTPTQTATHTATPEPSPTLSPVEPLLEEYFTGQSIDVSLLNPADYKEFSVKLTEKMNEKRGINPVLYKDEAYINPTNYMMMNYDRHPDIVETITMYLAIAGRDGDGNLARDPRFMNIGNPIGSDNQWWTADDGLILQAGSPCRNAASDGTHMGAY